MPYNDPEPDDPNVLVGVILPFDRESVREMAIAFADEFARLGHGAEAILDLFRRPFYAGTHQAVAVLGEDAVRDIIEESVGFWGSYRVAVREEPWQR